MPPLLGFPGSPRAHPVRGLLAFYLSVSTLPSSISQPETRADNRPQEGTERPGRGRGPLQRPGSHEWRWEQAAQSLPGSACDSILREAREAEEMLMPSSRAHPGSKGPQPWLLCRPRVGPQL